MELDFHRPSEPRDGHFISDSCEPILVRHFAFTTEKDLFLANLQLAGFSEGMRRYGRSALLSMYGRVLLARFKLSFTDFKKLPKQEVLTAGVFDFQSYPVNTKAILMIQQQKIVSGVHQVENIGKLVLLPFDVNEQTYHTRVGIVLKGLEDGKNLFESFRSSVDIYGRRKNPHIYFDPIELRKWQHIPLLDDYMGVMQNLTDTFYRPFQIEILQRK